MSEVPDFRVVVTVKNNRLLRAMQEAGFASGAALAAAAGISTHAIYGYLNLRIAPIGLDGEFAAPVQRLAAALRRLPEDLFPEAFLRRALERNRVERDMDAAEFGLIMRDAGYESIASDPENALVVKDGLDALDAALGTLPQRHRLALELRYGLKGAEALTLEEIGERFGVGRERVRQMVMKAERMLRHPSRKMKVVADLLLGGPAT